MQKSLRRAAPSLIHIIKVVLQEFTGYLDWQAKQQIRKLVQRANANNKGHAVLMLAQQIHDCS